MCKNFEKLKSVWLNEMGAENQLLITSLINISTVIDLFSAMTFW